MSSSRTNFKMQTQFSVKKITERFHSALDYMNPHGGPEPAEVLYYQFLRCKCRHHHASQTHEKAADRVVRHGGGVGGVVQHWHDAVSPLCCNLA